MDDVPLLRAAARPGAAAGLKVTSSGSLAVACPQMPRRSAPSIPLICMLQCHCHKGCSWRLLQHCGKFCCGLAEQGKLSLHAAALYHCTVEVITLIQRMIVYNARMRVLLSGWMMLAGWRL